MHYWALFIFLGVAITIIAYYFWPREEAKLKAMLMNERIAAAKAVAGQPEPKVINNVATVEKSNTERTKT